MDTFRVLAQTGLPSLHIEPYLWAKMRVVQIWICLCPKCETPMSYRQIETTLDFRRSYGPNLDCFTKIWIIQVPTLDILMNQFRASAPARLFSLNQGPPFSHIDKNLDLEVNLSSILICYNSRSSKRSVLNLTL